MPMVLSAVVVMLLQRVICTSVVAQSYLPSLCCVLAGSSQQTTDPKLIALTQEFMPASTLTAAGLDFCIYASASVSPAGQTHPQHLVARRMSISRQFTV